MSNATKQRVWPWYGLALLMAGLDQVSKALWGETQAVLIPGVLSFHPARNTGIAFGLLPGSNWLLVAVSVVFLAAVAYMLYRWEAPVLQRLALSLALGGILGNLVDRAALGYVTDFIALDVLPFFPVFNLADAAIVVGLLLAALPEILRPAK